MFTSIVLRFATLGCGLLLLALVLVGLFAAPLAGHLAQTQTLYWAVAAILTLVTVLVVIGANAAIASLDFAQAMRAGMVAVACLALLMAVWAFVFYGYWYPQAVTQDTGWQLAQLAAHPLPEPLQSARLKELRLQPAFLQSPKFQAVWHFVLLFSLGSVFCVLAAWALPRWIKPRPGA